MTFCVFFPKSLTGDGVGTVSPNMRLYSQSYPSIYSSGAAFGQPGGQHGNGEREREKAAMEEREKARERAEIVDLDEEDEEEEEEEEDLDGRRRNLNESAGKFDFVSSYDEMCLSFLQVIHELKFNTLTQVFSQWMRILCPGTVSPSLSLMGKRRALMVNYY